MSAHSYRTSIDSDMGPILIDVIYEIEEGQRGDYDTETIEASIQVIDFKIVEFSEGREMSDFLEHLGNEIEEHLAEQDAP